MKYLVIDFSNNESFGFNHVNDAAEFIVDSWQEAINKGLAPKDCSCQWFYETHYALYVEDNKLSFDDASELN